MKQAALPLPLYLRNADEINLILPALMGTFLLLYVNIAKTFVYENDSH